jgi:hypothetical protein
MTNCTLCKRSEDVGVVDALNSTAVWDLMASQPPQQPGYINDSIKIEEPLIPVPKELEEVRVYVTNYRGRAKFYAADPTTVTFENKDGKITTKACWHKITFSFKQQTLRIENETVEDLEDPRFLFQGVTNFLQYYGKQYATELPGSVNLDFATYASVLFVNVLAVCKNLKGSFLNATVVYGLLRAMCVQMRKLGLLEHADFEFAGIEDEFGSLVNYNNYVDMRDPWSRLVAANAASMGKVAAMKLFARTPINTPYYSRIRETCKFFQICAMHCSLGAVRALKFLRMPLLPVRYHSYEFLSKATGFLGDTNVAREITIYLSESAPMIELAHSPLPQGPFDMFMLDTLAKALNLAGLKGINVTVPVRLSQSALKTYSQRSLEVAHVRSLKANLVDSKFTWTDSMIKNLVAGIAAISPGTKGLSQEIRNQICGSATELLVALAKGNGSEDSFFHASAPVKTLLNCVDYALDASDPLELKVRFSLAATLKVYATGVFTKFSNSKILDVSLNMLSDLSYPQMTLTSSGISPHACSDMDSIMKALTPSCEKYVARLQSSKKPGPDTVKTQKLLSEIFPYFRPNTRRSKQVTEQKQESQQGSETTPQHPKPSGQDQQSSTQDHSQ